MPLDKPVLDTRSFDQLVAEGGGQIPRLAPAWTDHNASDPGITLLELLAWLVEMDIFRLDRVPEESQRAFLRLLGIGLRPSGVAAAVVTIDAPIPVGPLILPRGLQLADAFEAVVFETTRSLTVSFAKLVAVFGGMPDAPVDLTATHAAGRELVPVFGTEPVCGAALYLGFDAPLGGAGDEVSLFVWTDTPEADRLTWTAIIDEWRAMRRDQIRACKGIPHAFPSVRDHYSAQTVWEFYEGNGRWVALNRVKDSTRALSLSGFVRFPAPATHAAGPLQPDRFFIRCRLAAGGYVCPPRLRRIALNAVPAAHSAANGAEEILGASRGHARERYALRQTPVLAGSTRLRWVSGASEDTAWREGPDWDLTGPHDKQYVLESSAGWLTFGDGRRGLVPSAGWGAWVSYRIGGGPAGNVPAGTLTQIPLNPVNTALVPTIAGLRPSLTLAQPFAASGGRAADDLVEAKARAMRALEMPGKAVTTDDYVRLAQRVPGAAVARACALANHHPAFPCYPAPGCVTVVAVPDCPVPRPMPNEGFLRAVAAYLGRRRLVTADVHVIAPCYDPVGVHAVLHVRSVAEHPRLPEAARRALDAFFDPLHGGPDGGGWPIGRAVYRAEVLALLQALPGVVRVTDLGLKGKHDETPRCGNLPLCPDCLPTSAAHSVQVRGEPRLPIIKRSKPYECP